MNPLWTLVPPLLVIPFIIFFGERRRNLREASIIVAGLALLAINDRIYSSVLSGQVVESGEFSMSQMHGLEANVEKSNKMMHTTACRSAISAIES